MTFYIYERNPVWDELGCVKGPQTRSLYIYIYLWGICFRDVAGPMDHFSFFDQRSGFLRFWIYKGLHYASCPQAALKGSYILSICFDHSLSCRFSDAMHLGPLQRPSFLPTKDHFPPISWCLSVSPSFRLSTRGVISTDIYVGRISLVGSRANQCKSANKFNINNCNA